MAYEPITQKQLIFLTALFNTRNLFASQKWFDSINSMDQKEYENHCYHYKTYVFPRLSKKQASEWISRLIELPFEAPEEVKS